MNKNNNYKGEDDGMIWFAIILVIVFVGCILWGIIHPQPKAQDYMPSIDNTHCGAYDC